MILNAIREATRPLHDRVELAVDLTARLASRESYTGLLERYLGFYAPIEARMRAVPEVAERGLDLAARQKAPWLTSDLHALRVDDARVRALPTSTQLPPIGSVGAVFGASYVLEGATLGGQIIRKQLVGMGIDASSGGSFFTGYGPQTGPMWKSFCAALEAYAEANPSAEIAIVDAAVGTFVGIEQWLLEDGHADGA